MCGCDNASQPDAIWKRMRTARKAHKCDECRRAINRGDSYEMVSGIWEGEPNSYKTCEACVILREHVISEMAADYCTPPLSMLLECARESYEESRALTL